MGQLSTRLFVVIIQIQVLWTGNTCSASESQSTIKNSQDSGDARPEKRPIPTDWFTVHFLFHAGSWAPHCASQRLLGRVRGPRFCGTFRSLCATNSQAVGVGRSIIWYQTALLSIFRFSHFHSTGSCGHVAADVNHLPPVWFLLNGPQGLLRGPPSPHRT